MWWLFGKAQEQRSPTQPASPETSSAARKLAAETIKALGLCEKADGRVAFVCKPRDVSILLSLLPGKPIPIKDLLSISCDWTLKAISEQTELARYLDECRFGDEARTRAERALAQGAILYVLDLAVPPKQLTYTCSTGHSGAVLPGSQPDASAFSWDCGDCGESGIIRIAREDSDTQPGIAHAEEKRSAIPVISARLGISSLRQTVINGIHGIPYISSGSAHIGKSQVQRACDVAPGEALPTVTREGFMFILKGAGFRETPRTYEAPRKRRRLFFRRDETADRPSRARTPSPGARSRSRSPISRE